MINAKLRFEILKRDWFRCHYCWKEGKDVSLEIDHIVPKSRWWDDSPDNLITCCRECNMWKGNRSIDVSELRKDKVYDCMWKIKRDFTKAWNNALLWKIEKWTYILFSKFVEENFSYKLGMWLTYEKLFWVDLSELEENVCIEEFKKWWEYCDKQLEYTYNLFISMYSNNIIEEVCDNDNRSWWDISKDKWLWDIRLNYILSRALIQSWKKYFNDWWANLYSSKENWLYYFVIKYSYRKERVQHRFNWWA